jgi:hypothetical protein
MKIRLIAAAAVSVVAVLAPVAATAAAAPRQLNFDVFLEDRPIGYQRFELQPLPDGLRVDTRASFEVRVLRIKAFEYAHRNTELWRGGCLQAIESETNANGTPYRVRGNADASGLLVTRSGGPQRLDQCVGTFAYWDKGKLLGRDRLLNSQTGEYVDVAISPLGEGRLEIGGRVIPVDRYAVRGEGVDITLSYAQASGEWLALDSRIDGRTLRYRRSAAELPPGLRLVGGAAKRPNDG